MGKSLDPQIVNPILASVIEELMTAKGGLSASKPFETAARKIDEYDNRMRIYASDKFDVPVYVAATNFYLNQGDMQGHRPRGTLICYTDAEVADKLFRAAGLQVPYDEDDDSMMVLCGSLCRLIADGLKDRLAGAGYVPVIVSPPSVYKNTIPEGVEFNKDHDEKQEMSFYFLKHKALVIEWTMVSLQKK